MLESLLLEAVKDFGTPLYVYDAETVKQKAYSIIEAIPYRPLQPLYACKANSNPHIMRILLKTGYGIDAASPGEVYLALNTGFPPERIVLTGSNLSIEEMRYALETGVRINLDSLSQIESFGTAFGSGHRIWLRYNPEIRAGTYDRIITAGPESKFGIRDVDFADALKLTEKYRLTVSGLHMHIGSMIMDDEPLVEAFERLLIRAEEIDTLEAVDVGGGIGVPYRDEKHFPLEEYGRRIMERLQDFSRRKKRKVSLFLECGRYIIAEAGFFLCRITALRRTEKRLLVGVDTGFTHFPRPAIYGAFHRVTIIPEKRRRKTTICTVVGNICESTDVLAEDVRLPEPEVGDLLVFHTAGAYCFSMASVYNARLLPAEVIMDGKRLSIIRRRTTFDALLSDIPPMDS